MAEAARRVLPGVLGEIVAATAARVEASMASTSLESMLERAEPSRRSLAAALGRPGARFVLEMKRRSPSRGDLRPGATVEEVAGAYRGLADAVSVLTEPEYFGGSLEDLAAMRSAVDVPVLRKDFILDPWQVAEARVYGADVVLLMLSVLDDTTTSACLEMCHKLSMEALVEVHTDHEMRRALDLDATIIGANNRDLTTLEVDLAITERLARAVPADRIVVTESGIGSRHDVARLAPLVDAFLIGSSLMADPDLRGAATDLTLGRFKVCGLTRMEDAIAARDAGAWRLGAVMAPNSPRCTTPEVARAMAEATGIEVVAVFRDQALGEIADLAQRARARTVQIHQRLRPADIAALREALPEVEIWAVYAVDHQSVARELPVIDADRLVVDAAIDGRSGGTGHRVDLGDLPKSPQWDRTIVAGGITPESARSILDTEPCAIDLSSSLEVEPGIKDHQQLQRLRNALRRPSRKEQL